MACVIGDIPIFMPSTYIGMPSVSQYISIAVIGEGLLFQSICCANRKPISKQNVNYNLHLVYLLNHSFL